MPRLALALVLAMSAASPASAADAAQAPAPEDRYLWLEDVTGDKALEWARARNAESARVLETGGFAALEKRILDILDSDARIPMVEKRGPFFYNFWRDAKNPRGLWRRTTLEEYRKEHPAWETVIDLDALGAAEKESWVWHGFDCLKPGYKRCLVQLSRGGADADVVREFDLEAKAFVTGGFVLPESKNSVGWLDADHLYVGTDFGPGSMTTSGYPRIAKVWKRGSPLAAAETVDEGKAEDMSLDAFRDHTRGFERDFVHRAITFYTNELFLRRDGRLVKVDKPDSANATVHRDLLLVELRDDWTVGGRTYPAGALLAADFEGFLRGERRFDVLFEPTERKSLAGFSPTLGHVLVNELDNVKNRVYVLSRENGKWRRDPLPGMPELGTV
ncbi:MAG TPA: S9 family peptidase, partial [Vicinamibacteria bacterium]|nr:S9 family peptidase [Vicinamibacteria bacterium]